MPEKIRELIQMPGRAGFVNRGCRGSHRNFKYLTGVTITISGNSGSDAKKYQARAVKIAISEVDNENK